MATDSSETTADPVSREIVDRLAKAATAMHCKMIEWLLSPRHIGYEEMQAARDEWYAALLAADVVRGFS